MSVAKFGRYNDNEWGIGGLIRGPRGEGFHLTSNGNYDMRGKKRLTNVGDPLERNDAVTYHVLDAHLNNNIRYDESSQTFNAKSKPISHLGTATKDHHAVNRLFLESNCLCLKGSHYNAGGKVIKNVGYPINANDAATFEFVGKTTD